jgi:hypothetical protein
MNKRTFWYAKDLGIEDEPLILSLIKYRQKKNRVKVTHEEQYANLVSSITYDGKQRPIIDLDFPHHIEPSSTPGHNHLYLDMDMSRWQWFWLMTALKFAGVIETGFYVWSIRRGGNFVRVPGTRKIGARETDKPTYGWFFKLKR